MNDDFANATTISSLPFSTTQDTTDATADPSDPQQCGDNGSVWFAYTPAADMHIQVDTLGSDYDIVLSAWTGAQGSLTLTDCNYSYGGSKRDEQSRITFPATAGTTYYFRVAARWNDDDVKTLRLSVEEVFAPENDNFADATVIDELPYSTDYQDLGAASMEPGEPLSPCVFVKKTVWYSFTPTTTQSLTVYMNRFGYVSVYRGTSLADLTPIGCEPTRFTFRAEAGTTYLFQIPADECCLPEPTSGPVSFDLDVAPDPLGNFYFHPADPSTFDTVEFTDTSFDPGRAGWASWSWDFGDGTTSTERNPSHRYTADGDYTTRLTATTIDGRTAESSHVIPVRTHDVTITKVVVPASVPVGHTIHVMIHVRNIRLPETVRVDLSRTIPGGSSQVGSLTQAVPVQAESDDETAHFVFSYTVTKDDAAAGTITFQAKATILGARDAIPGDNTLLSKAVDIR